MLSIPIFDGSPVMNRHGGGQGECQVSRVYASSAGAASGYLRLSSAAYCQSPTYIRQDSRLRTATAGDTGNCRVSRVYTNSACAAQWLLMLQATLELPSAVHRQVPSNVRGDSRLHADTAGNSVDARRQSEGCVLVRMGLAGLGGRRSVRHIPKLPLG